MRRNQNGSGHPLIILLVLIVLAAIGGAAWFVFFKDKDSTSSSLDAVLSKAEVKQLNEDCKKKYDDEDLCKFLSSWTDNKNYQSTITSVADGQTSTFSYTVDGDNSHVVTSANGTESYNVITIGNTTYTKDQSDGSWWKQTTTPTETTTSTKDLSFDSESTVEETEDTSVYKLIGKEACGNLTCFKYELTDTATPGSKQTIWFDTKDYLLRRWMSEDSTGSSDSIYSYENISVDAPSPVKELSEGQVVLPDGSVYDPGTYNLDDYDIPVESEE